MKVELDLNALVPPEERGRLSLRLILHGRQVCFARKPACGGASSSTSARRPIPAREGGGEGRRQSRGDLGEQSVGAVE